MSFLNERDLLIGLDRVLSVVLCTTYMSPDMIIQSNALDIMIDDNLMEKPPAYADAKDQE